MNGQRWICCGALVIMATACAGDGEGSSSWQPPPAPVIRDDSAPEAGSPAGPEASVPAAGTPATWPNATDAPADAPEAAQAANPVVDPAEDALSTFAIDVDTGSYTHARNSLQAGALPAPEVVRTEEFVNAFEQGYAQPVDGPFAVTIDASRAPFLSEDRVVVRVGVQGRDVDDSARPDATLTFVIDVSGSMADPGKLDTVKPALGALVESLRPEDRVAIVVYSDDTRVVLEPTPVAERGRIFDAVNALQPEGSTSVQAGLTLGYQVARGAADSERVNRIVLLSDGVANVGATEADSILEVIGDGARDGIDLVTVGFGLGEYNDTLMEQLADRGDGFYAYVDGEAEAVRLFSQELTSTLLTIGREAKIQVEFNPATVRDYRLLGFENRQIADDDFRDDSVDGGEIGAGHTVTALYEVTLQEDAGEQDWLARSTLRWLHPDTLNPNETGASLAVAEVAASVGDASPRLAQDILVAAFAETLRGSGWAGLFTLDELAEYAGAVALRLEDEQMTEFADLVTRAADLQR